MMLVPADDSFIVVRGAYADRPRYAEHVREAFFGEYGEPDEAGEAALNLFLNEGRVQPGGALIADTRHGDRVARREDAWIWVTVRRVSTED